MMESRKAQAAMEYLMTYGWAILVVMIVGVVMWQMGIFNLGGTTVTAQGFSRVKPQLAATGLNENGHFTLIFTNGVGTEIVLDNSDPAVFEGTVGGTSFSCDLSPSKYTISVGDNFKVNGTGCGAGFEPGAVYSGAVTVRYTLSIGDVSSSHVDYGTVRGPVEPA